MRAEGATGEIREFECTHCKSRQRRYFSHFEKPEIFPVVECPDCGGQAWLVTFFEKHLVVLEAVCA
jgi:hypothetical protein